MGFSLSDVTDFVGDAISWGAEKIGDAVEWVGDKVGDIWESKIGKIVIIAAAAYFAYAVLPEMMAATSVEAAAGTGVASAGAETLAVAAPGIEATAAVAGTEAAAAAGVAETAAMGGGVAGAGGAGGGVLTGTEMAAAGALEPISAAGVDLTLAGAAPAAAAPLPAAAGPGVLESVGAWAAEHPMMAFGGMMVGGQALSGYMAGEQQKKMEEQRIAEDNAARNRQNVWGVNYGEGGEAISAGDALSDLNRKYFDSPEPQYTRLNPYLLPSEREEAGVLDEMTSTARPAEMYAHRTKGRA